MTTAIQCHNSDPFSKATLITARCILTINFAFGMTGNAILCCVIIARRELRTPTNILIVNLALSGFLQCGICAPMLFHFAKLQEDFEAAMPLCLCQHFFRATTSMLQVFTLVAIGFERFQAVAKPFQREERKRRVKIMIVTIWTLSLMVGVLAVLFPDTTMNLICGQFVELCGDDVEFILNFNMFCVVPVGIASFCLTFILYVAMVVLLRKQRSTLFRRPFGRRTRVTNLQLNTNNNSNRNDGDDTDSRRKCAEENVNTERERETLSSRTCAAVGRRKHDNPASYGGRKSTPQRTPDAFQSSLSVTSAELNDDVKTSRGTSCVDSPATTRRHPVIVSVSANTDTLTPTTGSTQRRHHLTTSEPSNISLASFDSISTCENASKSVTESVIHAEITPNSDEVDKPQQLFTIYTRNGQTRTSKTGENLVRAGQDVVGDICLFDPIVREKGRRRVEAKAAKITAVTVLIFALCWLPYPSTVIHMYQIPAAELVNYPNIFDLFYISVTLSVFGSTINLVVYGVGNLQIRNELRRYWKRIKATFAAEKK